MGLGADCCWNSKIVIKSWNRLNHCWFWSFHGIFSENITRLILDLNLNEIFFFWPLADSTTSWKHNMLENVLDVSNMPLPASTCSILFLLCFVLHQCQRITPSVAPLFTSYSLTLSVTWDGAGHTQLAYQTFFFLSWKQLRLNTMLMRLVRVNQTSKAERCKTKPVS